VSSSSRAGRRPLAWAVLGVVLIVALLIGSGVFSSKPLTRAQRVEAIASGIKCPSCEDLSVADSNAQTAVTVRTAIAAQVAAGRTDQQIDDYLVARYGSAIVLTPPTSGWSLLVWILPLVGGVVAVGGLTLFVVRRRRRGFAPDDEAARAVSDGELDTDVLADRRLFLERSLADARAEHDAGDLSDADYQALSRRDRGRLEAVDARIAALEGTDPAPDLLVTTAASSSALPSGGATVSSRAGSSADGTPQTESESADQLESESADPAAPAPAPAPAPTTTPASTPRPRRSRQQRFLLGGSVVALSAAIVLVVVLIAVPRLPGQTETGDITLSQQQKIAQTLAEAAADEDTGNFSQAAQLYNQILSQSPHQPQATAQLGWLDYQVGSSGNSATLTSEGRKLVQQAVKLDPQDFAGHLYLGTILLLQDHNATGAVAQYQQFLGATNPVPGASVIKQAAPYIRQAYTQAGVALPSKVPAA
jgi:cytochrome c-type biogenesis protein CcmH